jgi:hypothetical protein
VARIRTIKPEFWQDEKLAALDPLTRLVFLGLISMADDAGRLVDNVKSIDGFVFPETGDSCRTALGILAQLGRILRYDATNGQRIVQIVNWQRHQRVDHPNKYVLPEPSAETIAAAPVSGIPEDGPRIDRNPLATTPTSTSTPTSTNDLSTTSASAVAERRAPEHTLRSCIGLVVEKLYFGNRPREAAMRNEASIAKALGDRYGYDRLAKAIAGLARRRDTAQLGGSVGPRQALSLKWLNSKKFDINQLAASEDAFYAADPEPRRGRGKATDISGIVASIAPRSA